MPEKVSGMSEIDGLVGTGDFHKISEIIDEAPRARKPVYVGNPFFTYEASMPRLLSKGGDSGARTFCNIPIMRGKFRSRSLKSNVAEANRLAVQSVKEISLNAQLGESSRVRITHAYEYDLSGEGIA